MRSRCMFMAILFPVLVAATSIHVPEDRNSIQEAIEWARDLDTILVAPGTYYENLDFGGKDVVVRSISGRDATVIDGSSNGTVVLFMNGETAAAVLEGFTIQHGTGFANTPTTTFGGGICVRYDSSPTLRDLIVKDNLVMGIEASGGGIGVSTGSAALIENVILEHNSAYYGGGLYSYFARPKIQNVVVRHNTATGSGGGMAFHGSPPEPGEFIVVQNVLLDSNSVTNGGGGGLWFHMESKVIVNQATLVNNRSANENYAGGGLITTSSDTIYIVNSIAWDNFPNQIGSYVNEIYPPGLIGIANSDIAGGSFNLDLDSHELLFYIENIDEDPLFQDVDLGDYRLAEDSPCINAGTPILYGFLDTLWCAPDSCFIGSAPDMGAFESPYGAVSVTPHIAPDRPMINSIYPNPFNHETSISLTLGETEDIRLQLFDMLGRQRQAIDMHALPPGVHQVRLDGQTCDGSDLESGVYILRIQIGKNYSAHKLSLLR